MRPSRTVAGAALTAALAVGALPGFVGSFEPGQDRPINAAAFRQVNLATARDRHSTGKSAPVVAGPAEGALDAAAELIEPGGFLHGPPAARARPDLHAAPLGTSWRQFRYSLAGVASFYDNGTTAMRLPLGTTVVICGAGGCLERVVTDYGPAKAGGRIVDMDRPDFFRVCGCGWWSGTTEVTIRVY